MALEKADVDIDTAFAANAAFAALSKDEKAALLDLVLLGSKFNEPGFPAEKAIITLVLTRTGKQIEEVLIEASEKEKGFEDRGEELETAFAELVAGLAALTQDESSLLAALTQDEKAALLELVLLNGIRGARNGLSAKDAMVALAVGLTGKQIVEASEIQMGKALIQERKFVTVRIRGEDNVADTDDALDLGFRTRIEVTGEVPKSFGNGTFEVGVDIQPGRYRSASPEEGLVSICMFWRLRTAGGSYMDPNEVIDVQITPSGPSIVDIKAADGAFRSQGCKPWKLR